MPPAPLPVVSRDGVASAEAECPVCLEPLSFSFRLPGEKPHIQPECGHSLHEACFTAVYGPPPGSRGAPPRKNNLGVCGVCRRTMKVSDGGGDPKNNKLAAITGMGDRSMISLYPGSSHPSVRSARTGRSTAAPYDPNEDDTLDSSGTSVRSAGSHDAASGYIVAPSIQVKPEFPTISRTSDQVQPLTCIVTVELPSRRSNGHVPGPVVDYRSTMSPTPQQHPPHPHASQNLSDRSDVTVTSRSVRPTSPTDSHVSAPYAYNATPAPDSPWAGVTEDLRNRIIDWKGHPLSGLGPLQMYDLLSVRRDSLVREFFVYLFKEAIICVIEEKKRGLGRLLSANGSDSASLQSKGVLRLKGRIYIRHIKQVTETSVHDELSLTIDMEDERLDSFILIFRDRSSLETWRSHISGLVAVYQAPKSARSVPGTGVPDAEEFGVVPNAIPSKAQRMLSGSTSSDATSQADSLLAASRSMSSSTSHGSRHKHAASEDDWHHGSSGNLVTPHLSAGPSNSLPCLPHTSLDLILVISLPPPNASPSTAALKNRVIKTALDFVIASLGTGDRLSLVTFEVGQGGRVRKTPFLCPGRPQGHMRLAKFVEGVGARENEDDDFLVRSGKEEKTDVVTAVNHGLDVVLLRKTKNPISGMVLVSDAADSTRRAQMDLVLARAEAANVPIHSFGYGRSHDPAALWLMSNHTSGTYTFVKDWYDLRECLAGCLGGMMSIGLTNLKLHMKIVDGNRFRIRKVSGGPGSIVSSDGHDVDVDVGELRYGERKEMLVELELDNALDRRQRMEQQREMHHHMESRNRPPPRAMSPLSATDKFVTSMGLNALTMNDDDMNLEDGMMDGMIDEVPVFEVDGAFFDPAAAKHVSRLAHPVLLTVTLLPISSPTSSAQQTTPASDAVIVRRRMELLASEMITRALVLVSRKNVPQAQRILSETRRILQTVLQTITHTLPIPTSTTTVRNRRETLILAAVRALQSIISDIQVLSEALHENVELFAHDQRNFGAQQAMILRDQKSWTGRTPTEKLFWTTDNSIELVSRSTDWVARD